MSYGYQFRFYHPHNTPTKPQVENALQALITSGARIIRFHLEYQVVPVPDAASVNIAQIVSADGSASVGFLMTLPNQETCDYFFQVHLPEAGREIARLTVQDSRFESNPAVVPQMLEIAKVINAQLSPWFAWGDHELMLDRLAADLSLDRVNALAWANLFSREFADRVGQTFLAQAPSHQTLTFKRGVLLLLSPSPLVKPDANLVQRVQEHFGIHAVSTGP